MPRSENPRPSAIDDACLSDEDLLSLLTDENATDTVAERHLEQCASCRRRLDRLAGGDQPVLELLGDFGAWQDGRREAATHLASVRESGGPERTAPVSPTELRAVLSDGNPIEEPDSASKLLGELGDLEIVEIIGEGGMGVVLRARDRSLDREVAVKMLKPSLARIPELAAQFFEEARAVAALSHENIVPIYQVAETRGVPYLVMPLARNQTLQDRLQRGEKPDFPATLKLCLRVTRGLAAAHAAGILHGDVKPDNVLIQARDDDSSATVWLADFGLARRGTAQPGDFIGTAGTPGFCAPEVDAGEEADARSDLYGLGALFEQLVDPTRTPPWFRELVRRLRRENPADRPASAEAVLEVLEHHQREQLLAHWARHSLHRCRRLAGKVALVGLPLLLAGVTLDLGRGSPLVNAALASLGAGGIEIQGRFGVYWELAEAVAKAESGDVIVVRGPGYYVTEGSEVSGKELTIRGRSEDDHPRIDLDPEASPDQPLIAVRNGSSVFLRHLSLVHEPSDRRSEETLPPLLEVTDSSLEAFDCEVRRLKVRSADHPSAIVATNAVKLRLESCWLHQNRSVLIEWSGLNGQPGIRPEIEMMDCLVSCDRLLRTGRAPDASSALDIRGVRLKANLNQFASFRNDADNLFLRLYLEDSHIQTRTAFLAPAEDKGERWVPRYIHFNFDDSQLAHLGNPRGMPGKDLPAARGSTPHVEWRQEPLFIEQTWKLIE